MTNLEQSGGARYSQTDADRGGDPRPGSGRTGACGVRSTGMSRDHVGIRSGVIGHDTNTICRSEGKCQI